MRWCFRSYDFLLSSITLIFHGHPHLILQSGYEKTKITSIVLMGCTNVSAAALEEVLQSFPCISSVDIRGCSQFRELMYAFKNIKWVRSRGSCNSKILEESHSKMRSLRQITEKNSLNSKAFRGSSGHFDGSVELGLAFDDDSNLDRKDAVSYALRQNCYKRRKLLNGRKPSAVLSRDAHMRRWLHRKSGNEYKKVEEFLAISLKDIMKENKSEFFVTKVLPHLVLNIKETGVMLIFFPPISVLTNFI